MPAPALVCRSVVGSGEAAASNADRAAGLRILPRHRARSNVIETRMWRVTVILAVMILAAACQPGLASRAGPTPVSTASSSGVDGAAGDQQTVPGGCAQSAVNKGGMPSWLLNAGSPRDLPYALAVPPVAAGVIFGYPLRSGQPVDPSNKVLWVDRKSTRLNSSHRCISYAVFCLKK